MDTAPFSSIEFHENLLSPFSSIEFNENLLIISISSIKFHENLLIIFIFQYQISWKFGHLHFPVSNFMKNLFTISIFQYWISWKICSLSPFSSIGFHENMFIVSLRYSGILSRIQTCHMHCALLLAGMAPKVAGCDVVDTKYTDILWKPLKQFRRYDGRPDYWHIWRKCYKSQVRVCVWISYIAVVTPNTICGQAALDKTSVSIYRSGKVRTRRTSVFDFIPGPWWDTRYELCPLS